MSDSHRRSNNEEGTLGTPDVHRDESTLTHAVGFSELHPSNIVLISQRIRFKANSSPARTITAYRIFGNGMKSGRGRDTLGSSLRHADPSYRRIDSLTN